jgi:hypothetical protein
MQEYQRGLQEENQLRQLIKSGIDLNSPEAVNQMYAISPTKGLEFQTKQAAIKKASSEASKLENELVDQKLKQSRQFLDTIDPADPNAPARYIAWHEANHRDPVIGKALAARGVTADQSRATIDAAIARGPEAFANLLNQSKLGTEKFIELNRPQYTQQTLGGTVRQLGTPGLGGTATVVPGSEAATTATPGQILTNETAKERNRIARQQLGVSIGHLTLAQQAQNKPIFNAEAGGFVTPPTKENPQGTFTPITGVQSNKDQQGAIKALRSAGYDPVTGEDNISKLIKKSTSGALQAGGASIASFFGQSTDGKEAISALAGTANQIALDLVGGKLGAGISNTDRDFIVSALGDVANPMKSAGERLAGWEAAKTRMLTTGLVPPPAPVKSSSGKTTPSAAPAAPNIDKLLEKYK